MFAFVDVENTQIRAKEASTVTGINLNGIFTAEYTKQFSLGNTGTEEENYIISSSGVNASVLDDVTYSTDNVTFTSTLVVSGVQPNEISKIITVKYKPVEGDVHGFGSFMIRVDEE
jgi:hypothetical protein